MKTFLKKFFAKRKRGAHKGMFGSVLVIGGNYMYSGSPIFNALAALRSGADLAFVAAPSRASLIASHIPDIISIELKGRFLNLSHVPLILKFAERADSIVIGGGLGRERETHEAIRVLLKDFNKMALPVVVDADAIRALAELKKVGYLNNCIITPHSKEFEVLYKKPVSANISKRKNEVRALANTLGTTILLKGAVDIVSNGKEVLINKTGSPYMSVGGTGDVLAGVCGALLARNRTAPLRGEHTYPFVKIAALGAYINGRAGEFAAKQFKESLMASDLIDFLPKIFSSI